MSLISVKNLADPKGSWENFGDVFFDAFRRGEQFSEKILPKYCLGAEISELSTLY
jgi:hypothetical protein